MLSRSVLFALTFLLVGAPAAHAASVSVGGDGGVFVGGDPVVNILTITSPSAGVIRVTDAGPAPSPTVPCQTVSPTTVECPVTTLAVIVSAGGESDVVDVSGQIAAELNGDAGDDALRGSETDDLLRGGAGDDQLFGRGGADQLYGNEGRDRHDGGDGGDLVIGGDGPDVLEDSGFGGTDVLDYLPHAAQGVRVTVGEGADDGENGGLEGDAVRPGFERIRGSAFDDVLVGSSAAETLLGASGKDDLDGAGGADTLVGSSGDDVLRAQDGVADAALDCDSPSGLKGTGDAAFVDAVGIDPEPVDCETVTRAAAPGGGTAPAPTPLPALRRLPTLTGDPLTGATLTCGPGEWSGGPSFQYAFVLADNARGTASPAGTGARYVLKAADAGKFVSCVVVATNARGAVTGRSGQVAIAKAVRMPSVRGLRLARARERILDALGGKVDFGSPKEQARDGRAIEDIKCRDGGSNGTCARARLRPGAAYATEPAAGALLAVTPGAAGKLPRIRVRFYDAAKDDALPKPTKRRFGDDCPLRPGVSDGDERAFINSVLGKPETVAVASLVARECRFSVKAVLVEGQDADAYVSGFEGTQIEGSRGARITVRRPKRPDLTVVVFHRRLAGRDAFMGADLSRGPLNPGLGQDGRLTALSGAQRNDVCFHVRESATGRAVAGAVVRAIDPDGRQVVSGSNQEPEGGGTDAEGNRCDSWRITTEGTYRFSFVRQGDNGLALEGALGLVATTRSRKEYTTVSGRRVACTAVECVQTALPGARARAAQAGGLLEAVQQFFATLLGAGRGVDRARTQAAATAAAGGGEASLVRAASSTGITPGFISNNGGTLQPSLAAPAIVRSPRSIADGRGGVVSNDGASLVPAAGGSAVAIAVSELIGQDGAGIVSNDGATIISGGAGNLLGQDAAGILANDGASIVSNDGATVLSENGLGLISERGGSLVSGGAGNVVVVDGRSLFVPLSGVLPAGTLVSGGGGNAVPVSRIG